MEDNKEQKDFWVECNVCRQHLKNWAGSTPCCGSIAFLLDENGNRTESFMIHMKLTEDPKPELIKIEW